MKSKIFLFVCGVAFSLSFSACKKNTDSSVPTPQTDSTKKVMVTLQPGGDFTFNQVVLPEGKIATGNAGAKTQIDSTIYMVELYTAGKLAGVGRFDRLDSVHFVVDPATNYTVRLTAIQRGTGPGLAYTTSGNSLIYFYPISGVIYNTMNFSPTLSDAGIGLDYQVGGKGFTTFPIGDPREGVFYNYFGEVIAYTGTATVYNVDPAHPTISVPLKRLAFGLKYTCPELTQGKLTISGSTFMMAPKVIYPNTIDSIHIYSAMDFMLADTINSSYYELLGNYSSRIVWELPDGRTFYLGKDSSNNFSTALPYPRLNRIINMKITLPSLDSGINTGNRSLGLKIEETPLTVNTPIRF